MSKGICLVAVGGNAISSEKEKGTLEEQFANIKKACEKIVELITWGYQVVITHGNGPQVGQGLIRQKLARNSVPEGTLDVCVAETQGQLGYMIQQVLQNELSKAGVNKNVATVITQVLVEQRDPAFNAPTKPIGPFYSKEEAAEVASKYKKQLIEDSGRGYRMVVPSPKPIDILEKEAIKSLLKSDTIVIAAGGGGIPVINQNGEVSGVEAVIDKDAASSILAELIGADYLILLTGVEKVCVNFRQPDERQLDIVSVGEVEQYLKEGQFPEGSMGPKIRAAVEFIKNGGNKAIITTLQSICKAIQGQTGTIIKK